MTLLVTCLVILLGSCQLRSCSKWVGPNLFSVSWEEKVASLRCNRLWFILCLVEVLAVGLCCHCILINNHTWPTAFFWTCSPINNPENSTNILVGEFCWSHRTLSSLNNLTPSSLLNVCFFIVYLWPSFGFVGLMLYFFLLQYDMPV